MSQGLPIGEPVNLQQIGGVDIVLGQQLESASIPIVLTSAQISTLTPLASVGINNYPTDYPLPASQVTTLTPLSSVGVNNFPTDYPLPLSQVTTLTPPTSVGINNYPSDYPLPASQVTTLTPPTSVGINNYPSDYPLPASQVTTLTPPPAITGFATSTKQSDGSQKTQIVDGGGNVVSVTGNKLDVNATIVSTSVDKWQQYCDLGKGYTTTTSVITVAGSAEVAYLLIKNPLNSGKTVRIHLIDASLEEATGTPRAIIKLYRDPTITANGTALTISNLLKSGGASVITVYRQPTISANGTLLYTAMYARDANPLDFNLGLSIQANENFLITVEPNATNLGHIHSILWIEE